MYLYDLFDYSVNFFNGTMQFMKFMFTPLTIAGFETSLPPIAFLGFGTLTAYLFLAIARWVA